MTKERIPRALREQVWIKYSGRRFERTCWIPWCKNTMNVFDFHVGHNIPESKGGKLEIGNLRPICARCNLSMSDTHTISEWMSYSGPRRCFGFICAPPPGIPAKSDTSKPSDDKSSSCKKSTTGPKEKVVKKKHKIKHKNTRT